MAFTTRTKRILTTGGVAAAALTLSVGSALAVANIGPGSTNTTGVKCVQRAMNLLDNAGLSVDGSYGSLTTSAVETFQSRHGDSVDGTVGPQTGSSIRSVANTNFNQYKRTDPTLAATYASWISSCSTQLP